MLDFLGLYRMAAEENIVGKIQFINQAVGFSNWDASGWETYLTRLLGRCLRHHFTEPGAVVKKRQALVYHIDYRETILNPVIEIDKVLGLNWPYRFNHERYNQAGRNAQEYWKRTSLFEEHPDYVDALFMWYNLFKSSVENLQRIGINTWSGLEIRYGSPMSRWHYHTNSGRYHATEAYREFHAFLGLLDGLLGNEGFMRTIFVMQNFNHERNRPRDEAARRDRIQRVRANIVARYTPHVDAVVEQDSEDLRDKFMAKLRAKGAVT